MARLEKNWNRLLTVNFRNRFHIPCILEITGGGPLASGQEGDTRQPLPSLCQTFPRQFQEHLHLVFAEIKALQGRATTYSRSNAQLSEQESELRSPETKPMSWLVRAKDNVLTFSEQVPSFYSVFVQWGLGIMTGLWSTSGIQMV